MNASYFEKKINVESRYVNRARVLRTSVLFQLIQELTVESTEKAGITRNFTLDRGLLWIIAKQSFDVKRMPAYDETITLRLYPMKTMHIFFPRYIEVYSEGITRYEDDALNRKEDSSSPIITGTSLWLLMNEKERTMVFPDKAGIRIDGVKAPQGASLPKGVAIPHDDTDEIIFSGSRELTAGWSLSDMNGHLNNSRYFDIADDLIPLDEIGQLSPKGFQAEYINEILPGDRLFVEYKKTADAWYFRGELIEKGKQAFRLKIAY